MLSAAVVIGALRVKLYVVWITFMVLLAGNTALDDCAEKKKEKENVVHN